MPNGWRRMSGSAESGGRSVGADDPREEDDSEDGF